MLATALKVSSTQSVTKALSDVEMLNVVGGLPEACKAMLIALLIRLSVP
jgi:hypothetical protein